MDYVISVRNKKGDSFGCEPGPTRFLKVPGNRLPRPDQAESRKTWVEEIMAEAHGGAIPAAEHPKGDILVYIHGYNNSMSSVMKRHRRLKSDLVAEGYDGAVISFDWPSAESALNYLEDRSDAKVTAIKLVDDCIRLFSTAQSRGCEINVHLLAHSTGAYVIREAFDDADDRPGLALFNWTVSQIALISGDVSQKSMSLSDSKSSSIYRHCVRLTNFSNPFDKVLKLSNIKRVGVAPRVGRIGLPDNAPQKSVNVHCGDHFKSLKKRPDAIGTWEHSWQIGDPIFTRDLLYTLQGDIDRNHIPTRVRSGGELTLRDPSAK